MKRLLIPLIVLALTFSIAAPVWAQAESTVTLWAGKEIDAGNVTVALESGNLTVDFATIDGWELQETHLYVGTEAPVKSAPGRFPYSHEGLPAGSYADSYSIPLSELGVQAGDTVYIAAHAELVKFIGLDEEGNPIYAEETGWADGAPIPPGRNWAMYFEFAIAE